MVRAIEKSEWLYLMWVECYGNKIKTETK